METGIGNSYLREAQFRGRQVWFAITNSPLDGDRLVHTWEEVTQRQKAEEELKEQAHFIQRVTQMMPDVVSVVEFPSRTILYTNRDTLTWVGFNADELSSLSFDDRIQLFHPDDLPAIQDFYSRFISLKDRQETCIDYRLKNKQGDWILLSLRGQVFRRDEQGAATQLLFVGQNITAQRKAEQEILRLKDELVRTATDKYRSLFDSIDEGFAIVEVLADPRGRVSDLIWREANPGVVRHAGMGGWVGKRASELLPNLEPDWLDAMSGVYQTGEPVRMEAYVADLDRWIDTYYSRVGGPGSPLMAAVFQDITERKLRQVQQDYLLHLSDSLRTLADPVTIQQTAMQLLGQQLQVSRAFYGDMQADQDTLLIGPGYSHDTFPLQVQVRFSEFDGDLSAYYGRGQTVVMDDVTNHPLVSEKSKAEFALIDCRAAVGVPLLEEGKVRAILSLHQTVPRPWTATDISLAQETAERTWAAVERARAEAALRQSEDKYRTLFESMDEGFHISELLYNEAGQPIDWRYVEVNAVFARQTGLLNAAGQLGSVTTPNTEPYWLEAYDQVLKTGESLRVENYHAATRRWYSAYASRVGGAGSRLFAVIFDDITDRKATQEALHASQQRFESIANLVPDLLWDSGSDGATTWYNQRWLEYTGQQVEEAIGWGWTQVIHPDDRATSVRGYKGAVAAGQSLRQEHRIRRHDGAYRWFVVNTVPLLDERGQVIKMYGAATDIHESRLAEAALQESEKRFRLAIEATELATWEWNLEANEVYWNEQHFRLFGLQPRTNPISPDAFMRHVHPQEQARIKHLLERAIAERGVYEAEFCAVLENGTQRYMSGYGRVTEERDGQPIKMSGVMFDVDDRRRAQDALQQSEERLQKALSIQTVGVTFFDQQTRIRATNQAFLAMSGVSQPAIDQGSMSLMDLTLPPWRPLCQQAMSELTTAGRSRPHEKELRRPDGTRWWGLFAGTRLSEDEFVEFVLDVTERRRAEEALREADGRKDEFLAMLAHELRNPMSTLRSGLQILTITDGKDQTSSDTIAMMNRQTDHLVRMVDDLLDVSRISQGKIELRKERVNLVSLVQQAVASSQSLFEAQGKLLHVNLPSTAIELEGDATRLSQVVTNLLTNGVRYTGEQGQVWLSLSHHNGPTGRNEAILRVRDNGIGLAANQLSSIFELFVQVDNSTARSKGGLGLGLTLVKRLVALHGGQVVAHSEGLGWGSTFTVHLPTLPDAAEPTAQLTPQASDSTTNRRILVIDDNADAGFTLAMLLKLKGYDVHTRTSGRTGLEAAEALQPAAILLDIGMPELDGYATCRLLREQPWGQEVVVIALTGYGQEEDRQRTKAAGFNGHLVKPVDLGALTGLLSKLLPMD